MVNPYSMTLPLLLSSSSSFSGEATETARRSNVVLRKAERAASGKLREATCGANSASRRTPRQSIRFRLRLRLENRRRCRLVSHSRAGKVSSESPFEMVRYRLEEIGIKSRRLMSHRSLVGHVPMLGRCNWGLNSS